MLEIIPIQARGGRKKLQKFLRGAALLKEINIASVTELRFVLFYIFWQGIVGGET